MSDVLFVLGAADPEMAAIESLLTECGVPWVYATVDGERVRPGNAYRADCPAQLHAGNGEALDGVYRVECEWDHSLESLQCPVRAIDHHRPGDPGYGRPPAEFLSASSLGQVISVLARRGLVGHHWLPDIEWPEDLRQLLAHPTPGEIRWAESAEAGWCGWIVHTPFGWRMPPSSVLLTAAADHCLGAAYRGECPGVDPDELMRWRVESRAKFQGRGAEAILADIERAREALRSAKTVRLGCGWLVQGCDYHLGYFELQCSACLDNSGLWAHGMREHCSVQHDCGVIEVLHKDDVRSHKRGCPGQDYGGRWCNGLCVTPGVPELPDAASREGLAYIARVEVDGSGQPCRPKIVLGGCTTPAMVEAFMREWAPAQGLVDVYGDPTRGFAGGYLP